MAHIVKNSKGFRIIAMTTAEAANVEFGVKHRGLTFIVDDNTNEIINDFCYYVPVLNRVFSKDTCKEWLSHAIYYDEDKPYEERYFNYYKRLLNL